MNFFVLGKWKFCMFFFVFCWFSTQKNTKSIAMAFLCFCFYIDFSLVCVWMHSTPTFRMRFFCVICKSAIIHKCIQKKNIHENEAIEKARVCAAIFNFYWEIMVNRLDKSREPNHVILWNNAQNSKRSLSVSHKISICLCMQQKTKTYS